MTTLWQRPVKNAFNQFNILPVIPRAFSFKSKRGWEVRKQLNACGKNQIDSHQEDCVVQEQQQVGDG